MAIHDYVIENDVGANFRADINSAFGAVVSQNSSLTEPTTTYAYMPWADTTTDTMKIRDAANTAWVPVYTLSTGIPLAGGGGGSLADPKFINYGALYDPGPAIVQVAATPIASAGVVYTTGDVFIAAQSEGGMGSNISFYICVAREPITFSSMHVHASIGAMYVHRLPSVVVSSPVSLYVPSLLLTSITLSVDGPYVLVSNATINKDADSIVAGNPFPVKSGAEVVALPWLLKATVESAPLYCSIMSTSVAALAAGTPVSSSQEQLTWYYNKLDTWWPTSIGIFMGHIPSATDFNYVARVFILNGTSVYFGHMLRRFQTAPNAEDPVYFIESTQQDKIADSYKFLDTVPVDANSIRIGTWKAGNILEVQIA